MNILKTLCLAAAFIGTTAAHANEPLNTVSDYFNNLSTLQTSFTQFNADGTISTGDFYMSRPGRLRMEYDANGDGALLLVAAGSVAIFDSKSNDHATQYPLNMTPLGPILAREVDLKREKRVDGAHMHENGISVFASDPEHPEYGVGRFGFSADPLRLESWTMTNELGETTHIVFNEDMKIGHTLSRNMFSIEREKERRNPRGDR